MIKLIATDMDGTFLNDNKEMAPDFWDVYKKIDEKGVKFVVASGRQYSNLKNIFNKNFESIIFLAENGSYVLRNNKELFSLTLEKNRVKELLEKGKRIKRCNIVLCGKKSAYIEKNSDNFFQSEVKKYYEHIEKVESLASVEEDEFIKIAYFTERNSEEDIYPYLKDEKGVKVVISGENWVDISHIEANKGTALEKVIEELEISKDETMAFGDYLNDLEMLKAVKYSFAMKNAHPKIKEISSEVIGCNNDFSVLETIKNKVLKEGKE